MVLLGQGQRDLWTVRGRAHLRSRAGTTRACKQVLEVFFLLFFPLLFSPLLYVSEFSAFNQTRPTMRECQNSSSGLPRRGRLSQRVGFPNKRDVTIVKRVLNNADRFNILVWSVRARQRVPRSRPSSCPTGCSKCSSVCGDNQGASPVTDCCCQAGLPVRSQLRIRGGGGNHL